jgi:hypothetical protein
MKAEKALRSNTEGRKMETKIEAELKRIGVDHDAVGPVDSICVKEEGGYCVLYDDHENWTGTQEEALKRLKALPAGAGWQEFWHAFQD